MSMAAIKEPFLRASQRGATSKLIDGVHRNSYAYTYWRTYIVLTTHLSLPSREAKGVDRGAPIESAAKSLASFQGGKKGGGSAGRGREVFRFNLSHARILVHESTHGADLVPLPLDFSIYVLCMALLRGSVA